MIVACLACECFLPGCRSLKEKRGVVKRVLNRVKSRFNVSAAEVDYWDHWQRTTLAFAAVAGERRFLEAELERVRRFVEAHDGLEILRVDLMYL